MTEPEAADPAPQEARPAPPVSLEPPGGGCGCGPTGCLTLLVLLFVVLLVAMVGIALFRPWPSGGLPRM